MTASKKTSYNNAVRVLQHWDGSRDGECIDIRAPVQVFPRTRWDLLATGRSATRPGIAARLRGARVMLLAASLEDWLVKYGKVKPDEIADVMNRLRTISHKLEVDLQDSIGRRAPRGPRKAKAPAAKPLKATSTELWSVWGKP